LLVTAILTVILWSFHRGWVGALRTASEVNQQLQAQAQELEAATVRLQRQSSQFRTATDIARAGYAILDLERLLVEVVNRIQEGFSTMGVYYAGLFLLDEEERSATLRAATGEVGQLVLETDYKLELDDRSTVGRSVIHRQPRMVLDVEAAGGAGAGAVATLPVPMPYTRSEIALPLRSRGRVLGALNLHSTQKEAFDQDDIVILQTMADQVAVAVDNARLFSQTAGLLEEVQAVQRRYLAEAWRTFLVTRPITGVEYTQPGAELPGDGALLRQARQEAVAQERTVVKSVVLPLDDEGREMESEAALVVPLRLHGQVIGTLALHDHGPSEGTVGVDGEGPWTDEDVAMVEMIAEQVALTVDNLRLMDQTQRRAAREQLISEIADRMQRAVDIEDLMRITAEGLNEAIGGSRAFIQMKLHQDEDARGGGG
jgi:GAF domain-containing protein